VTAIPLSERRNWVGASESAALFGVSPFTTRYTLWHEKAGTIDPDNLDNDERVMAGKYLEPAIAAWAAHKWTWPIRDVGGYSPHPTVGGMGCSLDFLTEDGAPVEIKNVDLSVFLDKWSAEGDEIIDAPAHYLIQVQHQLACHPKAPHAWLLACVGGNKLFRMKVSRHGDFIAALEQEIASFWQSLREGREPAPDFTADRESLSKVYAIGNGEVIDLRDNNRLPDLCAAYRVAKDEEKAAKDRAGTALAEIRALIGHAGAVFASGFTIKRINVRAGIVERHERKPYSRFDIKEGA
jgi:putative phage-type endonuclease